MLCTKDFISYVQPPKFYGLPKLYKHELIIGVCDLLTELQHLGPVLCPFVAMPAYLRAILSNMGVVTYSVVKELANIIRLLVVHSPTTSGTHNICGAYQSHPGATGGSTKLGSSLVALAD